MVARVLGAIPCVGWLLTTTLSLFGLGAIILTRVGARDYPETLAFSDSQISKSQQTEYSSSAFDQNQSNQATSNEQSTNSEEEQR